MILTDKKLISEDFINHRDRVRKVFSTDEGKVELLNMIQDSKMLDSVSLDDKESIANRNFVIKKLEEIGMLDRRVVKDFIDFYFSRDNRQIEMAIRRGLLAEEKAKMGTSPFIYKEI